ncbi:malto-oligosyltrehalose synthase [Roseococcus sp. SYP-B2431]|uniref:malto-oligosyltrehalose synthase n=1 Tax=Roseococcus sp. SYP-B2431 TaxID=2496640 RepID=UPI0010395B0C|nr:malto-oligosyltrehalose synthase [Roseococcus sp. SYP-B2431]TCH99380.1 malto-oligosyltrehalose synthase [Roseococcus sp. SYP-B2431]
MTRPDWRATYRLQLHAGFTFDDALAILPYLEELGVSHVYASPLFAARRGSAHGYDVVDPTRINPELGGEEGFRRLSDALRGKGMGLLLDIVPNHMVADRANPWWMGALAGGREGPGASIFDIDWERHPQLLLPVLGDTLTETLAQGAITLDLAGEGWLVACAYGEHAWPLRREDAAELLEAAGLAAQGGHWLSDRSPDFSAARAALRALDPPQREALRAVLRKQDLPALLDRQHWRPLHWRSGRDALSSRRFFNVNELVGVRVEREEVFALTHRLALELVREGRVDGFRIDHIDGLADPAGYTERLREAVGPGVPVLVEKILGPGEELRPGWPVDGTTGYERLNVLNRLFVSGEGYRTLATHLEAQGWVTGEPAARLVAAKRQMLEESFSPELDQLADLAGSLADPERAIEFARPTLRAALAALLVHCPAYRSYLTGAPPGPEDRALWEAMLAGAEAEGDPWTASAARWLAEIILAGGEGAAAELRLRFQQLSGPLTAKGLEDTEFYRYVALTSVNEVGGEIEAAAGDIGAFHAWATRRAALNPLDLTPLATHDTKRGPEVRARLNLLSLEPEAWIAACTRWMETNTALRPAEGPDPADEWLIYQTMLGAWPIGADRLREYLTKALREAKRHTRWENPQEPYEQACLGFAAALLEDPAAEGFRRDMAAWAERLTLPTRVNGLAQTILQLTLPGVPDLYQGTEWWDFSLVDPDNRRPVDYAARATALQAPVPGLAEDATGLSKQRVIQRLLRLRKERPGLFQGYRPLDAPPGFLSFTRGEGALLVMVPLEAEKAVSPPALPPGSWRDVLAEAGPAGGPFRVLVGP